MSLCTGVASSLPAIGLGFKLRLWLVTEEKGVVALRNIRIQRFKSIGERNLNLVS